MEMSEKDHELLYQMKDSIDELNKAVSSLTEIVHGLKINEQMYLKSNPSIPSGISTKVAYDKNGLIVGGSSLEISDIPEIPIEKVTNLRNELNHSISEDDLTRLKMELNSKLIKKGEVVNTGTKINYDINGLVINSSDLLPADIPVLPITKIDGLSDLLDHITSQNENNLKTPDNDDSDVKITPGVFPKITFNEKGKVVNGENLTINDIPVELISKINDLESKLTLFASSSLVDSLRKNINSKLDANNNDTTPGVYTKVKVDRKGLVLSGDRLTLKDLPELNIKDIIGLDEALRNIPSIDQFMNLNDTVSSIMNITDKISDVSKLQKSIENKVDNKDYRILENKVDNIQNLVDNLVDSIPNDSILTQLDYFNKEISNLSGRISTLENKIMKMLD